MATKIEKLLSLLDGETEGGGADRALYCLLKRYEKDLPEADDYFHKAFRQTDVTDSGLTDVAIWHLIGSSKVFWKCFELAQGEKNVTANVGGEA